MRQFFFLAFLIPFVAFNQSGMVKGKVLQAGNGLPIELAKIQMVDQQKGALSNENGDLDNVPGLILTNDEQVRRFAEGMSLKLLSKEKRNMLQSDFNHIGINELKHSLVNEKCQVEFY